MNVKYDPMLVATSSSGGHPFRTAKDLVKWVDDEYKDDNFRVIELVD